MAVDGFERFEQEYGTFVVANRAALIIFAGGEQMSDSHKVLVRELIRSL